MNGHFEADNTSYPVTYMPTLDKGLYTVTDMRCIGKLDTRAVPVLVAKKVSQKLNIRIQNGKFSDNSAASDEIKKAAAILIDEQLALGE